MISIFKKIVKQKSQETAIKYGKQSISYEELDHLSDLIAQLILNSGHTPEDSPFIGLYSSRTLYTVPMMIGIWKAGFAYVPMDPKYSSERIDYILDDCNLKMILTDCNAPVTDYPQVQWLNINTSSLSDVTPYPIHADQGRYAYVIYTSGTTGKPKGIPITHVSLCNLIEARKKLIPQVENAIETCLASIVFDVSVWEIFCPLMIGTPVYFFSEQEKNNPQRIADLLEEQHITTFNVTPTHLSVIPYRQFPSLKYLIFAGEPCPESLVRKWQGTCTVIDAYGPTESTVIATASVLGSEGSVNDIGLPMQGVTCYVLDEHLQQVPQGEKGELYIGGVQLTDGYLNKEELNRQKFITNPFVKEGASDSILYASGDLVYQLPNDHIIYCGRIDSQVKIHGFRIELGEVKTAIEQCPQVEAAAVEAATQGDQKYLRAFIKAFESPLDMSAIKKELKGKLPPYMVPTRLIEVANIPKNINGKTDFKALAAMLPSEQKADEVFGEVEEQIAAIWHDILGNMDGFQSDSDFIEVGGDSISMIFMMQRINQHFNIQLTVDDIYSNQKLNQLASVVCSSVSDNTESSPKIRTANKQDIPLSQYLLNIYVHCQFSQHASLAYNLVELMPFGPSLSKPKLVSAWNKLLQMHDAFHFTFYTNDIGKPYLKVNEFVAQLDIPEFNVSDDEALKNIVIERLSRPYDLEHGPLYFAELYHHHNGQWLMAVYMHHLISDGWSLDEVSQQLYALYEQKVIEPANSYADYVLDTYEKEQGLLGTKSKQFWDAYQQEVAELKLPGFLNENDSQDYTTGCVSKRLDHTLSEAIHQYCSQHHITLFSFLSSALMLVLYRVSRQQSFMIGYPSSGRSTSANLNTMGYFVHPYPMKFEESLLDMTFEMLCKHTIKDIREAESHSYALVKLPPVNFTLEDMRYETRQGINLPYQLAPLTLTVDADDKELQCRWLYRRALVDVQDIDVLNRCYWGVLQHIIESDNMTVRMISMLCKSEFDNQTKLNTVSPLLMPKETIVDVFLRQVTNHPDHLALKDDNHSYTYKQLDEASLKVATELLKDGLLQGAVGIYCDRSSQSIATIMGIIRAGCFYVPLNESYPKDRLQNIITDSGLQRLITTREKKEQIDGLVPAVRVYTIEDLLESQVEDNCIPPINVTPSSPAYIIYTSGTTGLPKGVVVPHASVVSMVTIGAPNVYCPSSEDRVIQFSTYIFDASVIDIFCALLSGATLITAPESLKKDPERLFQLMEEEKITWACFPPAFLHSCHHDATTFLKTILVGGESPSQEIIRRYNNITFINGYGPTENTVCSTSHTYSDGHVSASNCIGTPLQGVTCYVLDDDHNLLPDGVIGELYLGGLQLASGYHNRPELNNKIFIKNPFVSQTDLEHGVNMRLYATGDLVCRKDDGLLYFMGRKDFQVKIRGYRIELGDIENTLLNHPGVLGCIADVINTGDIPQIVAHIQSDNSQLTPISLRSYLTDKLPAYMIPTYWSFSDSFPLTQNGKIDRTRLPKPQLDNTPSSNPDEILTETECCCRSVISKILGIQAETIDIKASLTEEIGMNSLHVLEYVSQMQTRGYQLHVSDIYINNTIQKLAAFIDSHAEPLTLEQINKRVVYFATPDYPDRPLLIVFSGYPYYEWFYTNFHNKFKDDYSILVVETPIEFYTLRPDYPMNIDALMSEYARLMQPILQNRNKPIVTTGLCIGGDMALRFAVELDNLGIAKPSVVVIDGYACRSSYGPGWGGTVTIEGVSDESNELRNVIMHTLSESFEQRYYRGNVHLIACTDFEDEPGQSREQGIERFPINQANWKKSQPEMAMTYVDSVHMLLLHAPENLRILKEVIDSYAYSLKL